MGSKDLLKKLKLIYLKNIIYINKIIDWILKIKSFFLRRSFKILGGGG